MVDNIGGCDERLCEEGIDFSVGTRLDVIRWDIVSVEMKCNDAGECAHSSYL